MIVLPPLLASLPISPPIRWIDLETELLLVSCASPARELLRPPRALTVLLGTDRVGAPEPPEGPELDVSSFPPMDLRPLLDALLAPSLPSPPNRAWRRRHARSSST